MELTLVKEGAWDIQISENNVYYRITESKNKQERYFKYNLSSEKEINEEEFLVSKFGIHYEKVLPFLDGDTDHCIKKADGSLLTAGYVSSIIKYFDIEGNLTKEIDNIGETNIYSFDQDKFGNIWYAEPTFDFVGQYSPKENKNTFTIGNEFTIDGILDYPEDLIIYNNILYISDMGSKQLYKLDIDTKELNVYHRFNEPIWEYRQLNSQEFVRLESGVYQLRT